MGKNSPVDWTDHLFNPWIGCAERPPRHDSRDAETDLSNFARAPWGEGVPLQKTSAALWSHPLKWNAEALAARRRRRIFCAGLADVFDAGADPQWRDELWSLIRQTPFLDWVLSTRRPENIPSMLPGSWGEGWRNVVLLTCVEDQERASARIPLLLAVPARCRAVAVEPILGPVKLLRPWLKGLDWVLAGGETGGDARPLHPEWIRSLQKQCASARVRFFFKQWGSWTPDRKFAKTDGSNAAFFPKGSDIPVLLEGLPEDERRRELALADGRTFVFRSDKQTGKKLDGRAYRSHPLGRSIPEKEIVLPLTTEERRRLQVCEKTVREGMGTFVAVGTALMEIRNSRLYRQTHPTFEAYVQSVLALTRPRAYQLIDSAQVMRDLSTIADIPELPKNEGQARELGRWKTARERVEKWKAVLAAASGRPVTARFIRKTLFPNASASSGGDARQVSLLLGRLRGIAENSGAEAKALKLIARLEEIFTESNAEAKPQPRPELWLPGFE